MEYEQNFGPVPNLNFNANMIEENTISGGRGGRTTRSSRGRSEISECVSILIIHHSYFTVIIASLTPAGKKGVAATSRVISSPEDTPVPTPSPAPRRRGRPRKNPVMEHSSIEDESTLFCIIRNGKSSLQVEFRTLKLYYYC